MGSNCFASIRALFSVSADFAQFGSPYPSSANLTRRHNSDHFHTQSASLQPISSSVALANYCFFALLTLCLSLSRLCLSCLETQTFSLSASAVVKDQPLLFVCGMIFCLRELIRLGNQLGRTPFSKCYLVKSLCFWAC